MGGDFGMVYPLWTDPQGPGRLLDRVVGEVGLDHLTIPVVTGQQQQFRLHPAQPPHDFATEGGWHFLPNPDCYKSSPLRPRPARWFGKRDVLTRLCDDATRRDMPVIFRIDLRAVTSLVAHRSHLRTRNAWSDESTTAGGCALNADLRELLHGTLEDLLRYEPAGFQLVDWAPDLPAGRDAPRPLAWHPHVRRLLDVCFCPACRQVAAMAGTDPDQAARSVQVHVARLLARPEDNDLPGRAWSDEVLDAYLQAKRRDTAAWLRRLAENHRDRRRYLLSDMLACESIGVLPGEERFSLLVRTGDEDASKIAIRFSGRACGLSLPVWRPAIQGAGQLVRQVSTIMHAGLDFLDFEGLDEAPEEAITWLRQAVRFARRS